MSTTGPTNNYTPPPVTTGSPAQPNPPADPAAVGEEVCASSTSGYYSDHYGDSWAPPAPAGAPLLFAPQAGTPFPLSVQLWEGPSFAGELIPMIDLGSMTVRAGQVLEIPPSGVELTMPDGRVWRVTQIGNYALAIDMSVGEAAGRFLLYPDASQPHVPFQMVANGGLVFSPQPEHLGRGVLQVTMANGEVHYLGAGSVIPVSEAGETVVRTYEGETLRFIEWEGNVYRLSPSGKLLPPCGTNIETIEIGGKVAMRFSPMSPSAAPSQPGTPAAPQGPAEPSAPSLDDLFYNGEIRQVRMPAPTFGGEPASVILEARQGGIVQVFPRYAGFSGDEFIINVQGTDITVSDNQSKSFDMPSGQRWTASVEGGELVFTEIFHTASVAGVPRGPGEFIPFRGDGVGIQNGIEFRVDGRTSTLFVNQTPNGPELLCYNNLGGNPNLTIFTSNAPRDFTLTTWNGQYGVEYHPDIPTPQTRWDFRFNDQSYIIGRTSDGKLWQAYLPEGNRSPTYSIRQCQEGEQFGPYVVKNGSLELVDQPPQIVYTLNLEEGPRSCTRFIRPQETYTYNLQPGQNMEVKAGEESYIVSRTQVSTELTAQRGSRPVERTQLVTEDTVFVRSAGQPPSAAVPIEQFQGGSIQLTRASPGNIKVTFRQPTVLYAGAPIADLLTMELPPDAPPTGTFEEWRVQERAERTSTGAAEGTQMCFATQAAYAAGIGGLYGMTFGIINPWIEQAVGPAAAPVVTPVADTVVAGVIHAASGGTAGSFGAGGPVVTAFAPPVQRIVHQAAEAVGIDTQSTGGQIAESGATGAIVGALTSYVLPAVEAAASEAFWPLLVANFAANYPENAAVFTYSVDHALDDTPYEWAGDPTRAETIASTAEVLVDVATTPPPGSEWCMPGPDDPDCWIINPMVALDIAEDIFTGIGDAIDAFPGGDIEDPFQNGFIG